MDREYIKALVRMVIMNLGECALVHIFSGNFDGIPVVDFMEVFLEVAETEFTLDDNFIEMFKDIKTTDDLEWWILYRTSLSRNSWR